MKHEERIHLLLHPEQYSDGHLRRMLADDAELAALLQQLALTKQAFVKREADEETISVDAEWEKFVGMRTSPSAPVSVGNSRWLRKIAAVFIGILFTFGIAFAAVHVARQRQKADAADRRLEASAPTMRTRTSALPVDSNAPTPNTQHLSPVTFDNTPLETMLSRIASHYNKGVEFLNDDRRRLRFYFVWKPDEGIDTTLHRLNLFESIDAELKDNTIVVR